MNGRHVQHVLAIADRPGWAIDHKTRALQRALAGRFNIVERFQDDVTQADVEAADIVLLFYWLELRKMRLQESVLARHARPVVVGICSHREFDGRLRRPGLAVLRRLASAVFANSRQLEREFAPLLDVPVHYTPNGVDTTRFRPPPVPRRRRPGELNVGWAGSLRNHGSAHRGFHNVIEPAVAAVPGARLVTAIREHHCRSHDDMPAFYQTLDVYVCASRSEGTPNPCLEAAACGVPLVTTPVGNMPELVRDGENSFFFDGKAKDLAKKLTLLRDDPPLSSQLSSRMLETIRDWDWRLQATNYARMFDSVLHDQSGDRL